MCRKHVAELILVFDHTISLPETMQMTAGSSAQSSQTEKFGEVKQRELICQWLLCLEETRSSHVE
jgi:hypothetical protein